MSLTLTLVLFGIAGVVTVVFGVRLTLLADEIAHRTRLGTVFVGAVLLGALTSLAEIGTSGYAAITGHAALAVSNALGSIAAQTVFIAVVDLTYRRANLEHAAASVANLMLVSLLVLLIGIVLFALVMPAWSVFGVHPASLVLLGAYFYGMRLVSQSGAMPMWRPQHTAQTDGGENREVQASGSMANLWLRFAVLGATVAFAGTMLAYTGIQIAEQTGLSESFVGALATGVVSSMPELITALTAVRIGALTLAISNIVGGNAFDVVVVGLSDLAYTRGPIYADAGDDLFAILTITLVMTAIVLMGLLRRERHGLANIGLEGILLFVCYGGLVALLVG